MRISSTFLVAAASMMFVMSSCVSPSIYTEPGIQPVEESMITKSYYWEKGKDPDTFSDAEVRKLFDRAESQDRIDGERSEIYSSQLVWALTAVGDKRFAEILRGYPHSTRAKVGWFIDGVWTYHKLNYPLTEAAIRPNQGEQASAGQPATRSESDSEGGDKPQPESEGRSR